MRLAAHQRKQTDPHVAERSRIRLGGAKDRKEADKFRGVSKGQVGHRRRGAELSLIVLSYLIDDILEPAMPRRERAHAAQRNSRPLAAGYFHECLPQPEHPAVLLDASREQAPRMEPHVFLKRIRDRRNITEADPTYQREYLGRWVAGRERAGVPLLPSAEYEELPTARSHGTIA